MIWFMQGIVVITSMKTEPIQQVRYWLKSIEEGSRCAMGNSNVCQSAEEKAAIARNLEIEQQFEVEKLEATKIVKLLLLGAGESGKSTILKQMKILHDNGFTEEEINQQRAVVYNNTINGTVTMLKAMDALEIRLDNQHHENHATLVYDVLASGDESEPFTKEIALALKILWSDAGLKEAYTRRNEFQLPDSIKYFLDEIDRISLPNYRPTQDDVLHTRVKTTGIVEVKFELKNVDFRVFDVGGQRSERKKWIHCFEDVNAIIFITAMSEYDQVLHEDEATNRMVESMRLFDSICNSKWFVKTSMILFLNKKDLFEEKIQRISINVCFPDYNGLDTYDASAEYIEEQFEGLNENLEKSIYSHQTCATDTNQVQFVLDSTIDMVIEDNLHGCGLY